MNTSFLNRPILLSLLSGLLAGIAWPGISPLFILIFFAFVPMFFMEEHMMRKGGGSRTIFFKAFLGFLLWNILGTYFIFYIRDPYAVSGAKELLSKTVASGLTYVLNASFMAIVFWLFHVTRKRLGNKAGYIGLLAYWMTFEYLHMHWSINWPWLNLGNAFAQRTELVQWYAFTGSPGGTLWVLVVNMSIYFAIKKYREFGASLSSASLFPLMLMMTPILISLVQYVCYDEKGEQVEVVLLQPNLDPYDEKFDSDPIEQLQRMLYLADSADTPDTQWYIMPETALVEPTYVRGEGYRPVFQGMWEHDYDAAMSIQLIRSFLKDRKAIFIAGAADRSFSRERTSTSARYIEPLQIYYESYNSTLLIDRNGVKENYHKSKLVPGVESIPFTAIIGFLDDLALDLGGASGSLGVQDSVEIFSFEGHAMAPTICYESVFGEYTSEFVSAGAHCIAISTNDSWWQDSPGYLQLLAYSRLRAIECRRDIARSANTGISCFIDQRGDILSDLTWWKEGALKGQVHMNDELTFYVRYGDFLSRIALLLTCLLLLWTVTIRFKN